MRCLLCVRGLGLMRCLLCVRGGWGAQVKVVVGIDLGDVLQEAPKGPAPAASAAPPTAALPPWSAPRARKAETRRQKMEYWVKVLHALPLTPAPSIPQEQGLSLACGKYFLCGRVVQAVGACEESCLFLGALWVGCADLHGGTPSGCGTSGGWM